MPPTLGDKCIRREIKVYGVEGPVLVSLSSQGIEMKAKGTKLGVVATWPEIVEACKTSASVPSKFEGRSLDFLKFQALERQKRMTKKLAEKVSEEIEKRQ